MPLYEGIALVGEKHPVILDIGTEYTKCGFAGERAPRFITPSVLYDWKIDKTVKVVDFQRESEEQFRVFAEFIHHVYYKYLLVSPKERRVVIVESILCPTDYRNLLGKVLFQHFQVPSAIFMPIHLAACFPLGTQNALVVDIGFRESVVMPIYEGMPLLNSLEAAPLGSQLLHSRLRELLQKCIVCDNEGERTVEEANEEFSDDLLEDIKTRICFVTHRKRGLAIQDGSFDPKCKAAPSVEYPIKGTKVLRIPGKLRESLFEALFEPDIDDQNLPSMIIESLLRCPLDIRKPLAEAIVIIGGTCMVPGFLVRLKAELLTLFASERFCARLPLKCVKFFKTPCKENVTAWLGGSIFGSLDILPHRSINSEAFAENSKLPDWTTFAGNSPSANNE